MPSASRSARDAPRGADARSKLPIVTSRRLATRVASFTQSPIGVVLVRRYAYGEKAGKSGINSHHLSRFSRRDQRPVCCAPRATGRPCLPLNHARSASQTARSSRAAFYNVPQERRASVCGSAAALRSGCISLFAPLRPPLHFPRSPTTDRSRVSAIADGLTHSSISD